MPGLDYSTVTEQLGHLITQEALSMLYTRYRYASQYCAGKSVLEVACGSGVGACYLAKYAGFIVAGDYTKALVETARRSSQHMLPFMRMDAQALPLTDNSVDVVLCYEALYYLPAPDRFLEECRRILRSNGVLLLCSVNPEWPEFNPSPLSYRYYSATALAALLRTQGFSAELLGAFSATKQTGWDYFVSWAKRVAVTLGLIPATMKGKQCLKRLFLGPLVSIPSVLAEGLTAYHAPVPVRYDGPVKDYKILFAVARSA